MSVCRLAVVGALVALTAGVSNVASAEEPTPSELEAIERALEADQQAREKEGTSPSTLPSTPVSEATSGAAGPASFLPDISLTGDFALAAFSTDAPLQTGGHDPQGSGFHLQQLELVLGKAVDPYFRFDAVLVFALYGVEIEEVYGTTLALPANLQVRAGQFLTRFGRVNSQHVHQWNFVDQPFALGRVFGSEGNRGLGVELSYLVPLPWFVELVGSITDPRGEGTARSFYGPEDVPVEGVEDFQYTGAIKQFVPFSDDLSFLFGFSAANGPNPSGPHNRTDVYGVDAYLKYRPLEGGRFTVLSLQTEWFLRRRQVPGIVAWDLSGYTEGLWRFAQRWNTALRYELGTPTEGGGETFVDPLDPEWTLRRSRVCASVSFLPTEFSRLRAQVNLDDAQWLGEPNYAAFLQLELGIGTHAAHKF